MAVLTPPPIKNNPSGNSRPTHWRTWDRTCAFPRFAIYTYGFDLLLQEGARTRVLVEGTERVFPIAPAIAPDGVRIVYSAFDQGAADGSGIGASLY